VPLDILMAVGVGLFYALIALLASALVSGLSVLVVILSIRALEGVELRGILQNPSVRYACMLSVPFTVMGVSIGLVSGLSRNSVVGSVVPSVLTLMAAASTYFYARGKKEALIALVAMISISLALVVGMCMGSALRPA
jgi:hypothetical protein